MKFCFKPYILKESRERFFLVFALRFAFEDIAIKEKKWERFSIPILNIYYSGGNEAVPTTSAGIYIFLQRNLYDVFFFNGHTI